MNNSFSELMMFFFVYAFVGWCVEVIYYTVTTGKFVNRGFLNGPICPVYGVSFTIIIMLLTPLVGNLAVLFCGSFFLATLMEFLTGFILEKIFNDKWWDYSDEPFNIKGYVCLKFSLMWGLSCTAVMQIVHPIVGGFIEKLPDVMVAITVWVLSGVLLCDLIFTVAAIQKLRVRLKISREISEKLKEISDHIGEDISEMTINVMEKTESFQEDLARSKQKRKENSLQRREKFFAELNELKEKYQQNIEKKSFTQNRLDKAFPHLDFDRKNENGETLKERIRKAIEKYKND